MAVIGKVLAELWKLVQVPAILFGVWLLNIRPFTLMIDKNIFDIKKNVADLSVNIIGALDVALLTLLVNLFLLIIKLIFIILTKLFFKVMTEIKAALIDSKTKKDRIQMVFNIEKNSPELVLVKGEFKPLITKESNPIYFFFFEKLFNKTYLVIDWPAADLSVKFDILDLEKKVIESNQYIKIPLNLLFSPKHKKEFCTNLKCSLNNATADATEMNISIETFIGKHLVKFVFTKIFKLFNTVDLKKIEIIRVDE